MKSGFHSVDPSDLEKLKRSGWVSQEIMGSYFEFLSQILLKTEKQARVHLMDPTLVLFMAYEKNPKSVEEVLESSELSSFDFLVLPVMTKEHNKKIEGEIWSLLVFSRETFSFFSFNPSDLQNGNEETVLEKIKRNLGLNRKETHFQRVSLGKFKANLSETGVLVIIAAEIIVNFINEEVVVEKYEDSKENEESPKAKRRNQERNEGFLEQIEGITQSLVNEKREMVYEMMKLV